MNVVCELGIPWRTVRKLATMVTATCFALALGGCDGGRQPGTAESSSADAAALGTLTLNLVGQGSRGTTYRLRNAIVMVQGPDQTLFFDTEKDPDTNPSASVTPGSYSVFLQEGWALERTSDGKRFAATLLSTNPELFSVASGKLTSVALRFLVEGDRVSTDNGAFEIALEVDEAGTSAEFCATDSECRDGGVCCISGFLGTCRTLEPGQSCPLPDLTISAEDASTTLVINTEVFPATSCAIVEGCVGGPGERRLLRFDTVTPNVGDADFVLGDPENVPGFEFAECHGHFHFEGYARYELADASGAIVAEGHKQAFCLLDSLPVGLPGAPTTPRFHCGFQGLTRGWADVYDAGLDCQWVDITGVPAGDYLLRLSVNPDRIITESNYDNNTIEVPVTVSDPNSTAVSDPLAPCVPGIPAEDCGWSFAPGFDAATCNPGELVNLGCGCACVGDPILRVCSGTAGCSEAAALASQDDTCGLCPALEFVCPEPGVYSVMARAFDRVASMTCDVTRN